MEEFKFVWEGDFSNLTKSRGKKILCLLSKGKNV